MSSPKSFTGRTRRRNTRWRVRATDKLAHGLIVGGGIGTIVAVSMVCVFLLWVVLPLFQPATVEGIETMPADWGKRKLLHLAVDEYRGAAWALLEDGTLDVFRIDGDDRAPIEKRNLFPDGPKLTCAAFSLTSDDVAVGFADGSIRLGTIGFLTHFVEEQLNGAASGLKPGESMLIDKGLVERPPEGQLRRQEIAVRFGEPLASGSSAAITDLDLTVRTAGPLLCSRSRDGELRFHALKAVRSLESDEKTYQLRSVVLPQDKVSANSV